MKQKHFPLMYRIKVVTDSGATIVELALILPVFFLLLFAIFEYTFYLTTQSLLQVAAQRAASLLAVATDIDKTCEECAFPGTTSCVEEKAACGERRERQISQAKRTALEFLYSTPLFTNDPAQQSSTRTYVDPGADFAVELATFGENPYAYENRSSGIDLVLPEADATQSRKAAFSNTPIRVIINGQREPMLLPYIFRNIVPGNITVGANTWKEISINQSNPPALDCEGNPITDPTNPNNNKNCRCLNSSDPNQVATAPGATTCVCIGNMVSSGGGSSTTPVPVGALCQCPSGKTDLDGDGICTCETTCPDGQKQLSNCGCENCPNGGIFIDGKCEVCSNTCAADEHTGYNKDKEACDCFPCEIEGQIQNPAKPNECTCPTPAQMGCPGGSVVQVVDDKCQCVECVDEFTPNFDRTACVCNQFSFSCGGDTPVKVTTGGECTCKSCEEMIPGSSWDGTRCTLCPSTSAVDWQGRCEPCKNGGERDPNNPRICECLDASRPTPQAIGCAVGNAINQYCGCEGCVQPGTSWAVGADGKCFCPHKTHSQAGCSANEIYSENTCQCQDCTRPGTSPNQAKTGCECTNPALVVSNCSATQHVNSSCICALCPLNHVRDPSDPTKCECDRSRESEICGAGKRLNAQCNCECIIQEQCSVFPGQIPDGSCGCKCPNGQSLGTCVDTLQTRCLPNSCIAQNNCRCSGGSNEE